IGTIRRSFGTGAVSGTGTKGGLAGRLSNHLTVAGSYWDTSTTGQSSSARSRGQGLTTAQFQDTAGFMLLTQAADWGFENVWAPSSAGHHPALYALSPVVWVDTADATRTYGDANPSFSSTLHGGPSVYVRGLEGDILPSPVIGTGIDETTGAGSHALS